MASARAEAVDATVNRAGARLRTCTRRKPARTSCNATAKISSGARSGRAGSLKDEGNRARRPLRGADVVRQRAHQPMSGLKRTTEVVEHREGRGPTAAPEVSRGGKKGAPTAVPALRAVPPVKRGSCRGSVVPGSPS